MIIFPLLHFIFLKIVKSEIKLSFEKQYYSLPLTKENIFINLFYNQLIAKINIGSGKQEMKLLLKFLEYNTFIFGKELEEKNLTKYKNETSSTFKLITKKAEHYVIQRFNLAYKCEDTFYLNNKEYKNFKFLLVTELNNDHVNYKLIEGGVLGLKKETETIQDIDDYTFIIMLKKLNYIDSYSFTIKYDINNKNKGEIIFGNDPHEYDKNYNEKSYLKTRAYNFNGNFNYGFIFDEIYSNENYFNEFLNAGVAIDFGVIIGVPEYKKFLDKLFFSEKIKEGKCFSEKMKFDEFVDNIYLYSCDENVDTSIIPNLNFQLKEIEMIFTFTERELWFKFEGRKYFLILFRNYGNIWILGEPFLRKYQLVINQDYSTFGYYNQDFKKSTSNFSVLNWVIVIFLFIVIIILIGYILKLLFFKPKKRIANELIDDCIYSNISNA